MIIIIGWYKKKMERNKLLPENPYNTNKKYLN